MRMFPIGEQILNTTKIFTMITSEHTTLVHKEVGKYIQTEHTIQWEKEKNCVVCGSFPVWKVYGGMDKIQKFMELSSYSNKYN